MGATELEVTESAELKPIEINELYGAHIWKLFSCDPLPNSCESITCTKDHQAQVLYNDINCIRMGIYNSRFTKDIFNTFSSRYCNQLKA